MRRALHAAGRAGFAIGVSGAIVGLAAAPALAATKLTVSPGSTVSSNGTVSATGTDSGSATAIGQSRTLTLVLSDPNGSAVKQWSSGSVASTQNATVTGSFDTTNPSWTSTVAINGTYTFALKVNGTTSSSAPVTLRIPAAKVAGFAASAGGTVAHFTWQADSEPDLAGYDLVDVTDAGSPRDLTPGGVGTNVCDSSGCSVDIDFGSSAAGTSRSFVVDALRYTSPSHSSTIASADSDTAAVSFPAPQPASSGAAGSGGTGGSASSGSGGSTAGGGTGSTTGGTTTGGSSGSGAAGGRSGGSSGGSGRGISANHPSAALKAYLPSFSAGAAPNLPSVVTEVKPLPEGTYKPTLAYPDQVVGQTVHHDTKGIAAVRSEVVRVLNVAALWKSLAGAALVLLVAAHLRAWVAGVEAEADAR